MDVKNIVQKLSMIVGKYKYALIILIAGVLIMLLPGRSNQAKQQIIQSSEKPTLQALDVASLGEILQQVSGAGTVRVMLSVASGERTVYQTNSDVSSGNTRIETVIITDAQRQESGLIQQVNPPAYLGAIVLCQGADDPVVRLEITQAVGKITGLSTDRICVLKMK